MVTCGYRVVTTYPHDPTAFTEGLLYRDGLLYESTGREGASRIIVRKLENLKPLRQALLDPHHFGEGLIDWDNQLISLTWRDGVGYRWDRKTLKRLGTFAVNGEGWGMTRNDRIIFQSDGSATLILRDPLTMAETGRLAVTLQGRPIDRLNELEWIDGRIWANVWLTEQIVRIDPANGRIDAVIDLRGLHPVPATQRGDDVLNGIAYDAAGKRILVTGKNWDRLYQIEPTGACVRAAAAR